MGNMYLLILFFPFLSFFFNLICNKYFGKQINVILTLFCLGFCFLCSLFIFFEVFLSHSIVIIKLYTWLKFDYSIITIGFMFDSLTSLMLIIISFISFMVHIYSIEYMDHDPYIARFLAYLSIFTFFMIFLVTSDNFLQLFLGWEGVGLCSYLLINFWFTRILANKAALKAMIMNRIADVFLMIGILLLFYIFQTFDYIVIFEVLPFFLYDEIFFGFCKLNLINLIGIFIFIGCIGKSAQIGFHTWLPDAMEGPTPVSALLHAATMVTAGVFLILRCSFIFEYSDLLLWLIIVWGGFTCFFSSIVGLFQYDIKKIIAYSTCSQLGYMFLIAGLSNYNVAIFHLFNHAFFKALLFLGAGSIIHTLLDEQDMRKMGGLINLLPYTFICFFFASLAIMGFPFLAGFYSKDLLLELIYTRYIIDSKFIYFLAISTAFFTAVYSMRLLFLVFGNYINLFKFYLFPRENKLFIFFSLLLLTINTFFVGYIFNDAMIGFGNNTINAIFIVLPNHFQMIDVEFIPLYLKLLPLLITFIGIISILIILINQKLIINELNLLYFWFFFAGFFNLLYNKFFNLLYIFSYNWSTKLIDKGFLELIGSYGLYYKFLQIYKKNKFFSPFVIFRGLFLFFIFIFFIILCLNNLSTFFLIFLNKFPLILFASIFFLLEIN